MNILAQIESEAITLQGAWLDHRSICVHCLPVGVWEAAPRGCEAGQQMRLGWREAEEQLGNALAQVVPA